jgi:hypothetical protein
VGGRGEDAALGTALHGNLLVDDSIRGASEEATRQWQKEWDQHRAGDQRRTACGLLQRLRVKWD